MSKLATESHSIVQQKDNMHVSIVVPVYRSQSVISTLVEQVSFILSTNMPSLNFEIILVNDGSPDQSWTTICELASTYSFVKGISLRRNFGQHNATMAGLNYANGKFIVIMDDDLQHPPSSIPAMLETLSHGHDVCYTHYKNRKHELWKKIGSAINDRIATMVIGKPKNLYLSSFKALRSEVVKEIIKYDGPYTYIDGLILNLTSSITSIEIEHQSRFDGKGNYNLKSSISLWLKMLTGFSVAPLRFASILGLIISAMSFIIIIAVIIHKIIDPNLAVGWASLISVSLFIGGIQLLCVGMMGEYLARTYLKINHKPQFVINHFTPDRND